VRRGCGGPDLRARTVARVEQSARIEAGYGLLVQPHPLRLAHHWTVPVDPKGLEVGELCLFHARTNPRAVEVLHAYQKSRPGRTREQPRQESCPQVPEVERASGTRRESSVGDVLLAVPWLLSGRERLVGRVYGIQTRTGDSVGSEARTTFLTPRRQSSRVMTEALDILRPGSTPVMRAAVLALCGTLASEPLDTAKAKAD
jgi:hypothetical protein